MAGLMVGGKAGLAARLPEMSLMTSGSSLCISDTDGNRLGGKSKPEDSDIKNLIILHIFLPSDEKYSANSEPKLFGFSEEAEGIAAFFVSSVTSIFCPFSSFSI